MSYMANYSAEKCIPPIELGPCFRNQTLNLEAVLELGRSSIREAASSTTDLERERYLANAEMLLSGSVETLETSGN